MFYTLSGIKLKLATIAALQYSLNINILISVFICLKLSECSFLNYKITIYAVKKVTSKRHSFAYYH